jgi:hypothetical protein
MYTSYQVQVNQSSKFLVLTPIVVNNFLVLGYSIFNQVRATDEPSKSKWPRWPLFVRVFCTDNSYPVRKLRTATYGGTRDLRRKYHQTLVSPILILPWLYLGGTIATRYGLSPDGGTRYVCSGTKLRSSKNTSTVLLRTGQNNRLLSSYCASTSTVLLSSETGYWLKYLTPPRTWYMPVRFYCTGK